MKRFTVFLLCFALLFSISVKAQVICEEDVDMTPLPAVPTAAQGEVIDISAVSAILMEPESGKVLYEMNSDEKSPPASITKIMSLILVMEAIENGQFSYDTMLSCSDTGAEVRYGWSLESK